MAADHQFGLYMTVSATSQGGGSEDDDNDVAVSLDGTRGPEVHSHHAVYQARDAAINFVDLVRRRAFVPIQSKLSKR